MNQATTFWGCLMKVRKAAVSGMCYAGTAGELEEQIEWCYKPEL